MALLLKQPAVIGDGPDASAIAGRYKLRYKLRSRMGICCDSTWVSGGQMLVWSLLGNIGSEGTEQ